MTDNRFDLRALRYFVEIARAGSVTGAARVLRIAQPALSRQMQKLERETGAPLFLRTAQGSALTAHGASMLERAETVLAALHAFGCAAREAESAPSGHIVLGLPPAAGLTLAPLVVERFRRRFPAARLRLREGISSSLEEWLQDRRINVAVLHNPEPSPTLALAPVLRERMVVAVEARAAAAGLPLPLAGIAGLPLILPSLPHSNRRLIEREAARHAIPLRIVLEADSVGLTKALVRRGLGCTILTLAGVQNEVALGHLAARPIVRPALHSTIAVASLRANREDALTAGLVRLLRECVADAVASGAWQGARLLDDARDGRAHAGDTAAATGPGIGSRVRTKQTRAPASRIAAASTKAPS